MTKSYSELAVNEPQIKLSINANKNMVQIEPVREYAGGIMAEY